jgi:hypothetical protein
MEYGTIHFLDEISRERVDLTCIRTVGVVESVDWDRRKVELSHNGCKLLVDISLVDVEGSHPGDICQVIGDFASTSSVEDNGWCLRAKTWTPSDGLDLRMFELVVKQRRLRLNAIAEVQER